MPDKTISATWFSSATTPLPIGIVVVEQDGERHAFIGCGYGCNEPDDIQHIVEWGAKLHLEMVWKVTQDLKRE
jgi:hypothetical protein